MAAAARRADAERVRLTGRWLVRRGTDRCAVRVGVALLGTVPDNRDIPLLQTIGLLSDDFAPLVADAMARCSDGMTALQWLGDRAVGWGRVHVVEKLCETNALASRDWLLRRACNGEFLNKYFAGTVAVTADLATAITVDEPDLALVDHTSVLLSQMSDADNMGLALDRYPAAGTVLDAHSKHVARLTPSISRYRDIANLATYVQQADPAVWSAGCRDRVLDRYLAVLNRPGWVEIARTGLADNDSRIRWLRDNVGPRLGLVGLGA
ncbi:hypothetical protein ACFVVM_17920 [Nocardia sp. NPDC058176]|uniref:hypothetical protein n=1 Tax=Nocardia sp. NPDC058176 TaxID=3346368 RepID=UPI0036D82CD1